ncbi:hypothetical protein Hanom_Chr07g00657561 [Helianthus anomalus]
MHKPFPSSSTISMGSLSLFRDWLIRGHPPEEPSITTLLLVQEPPATTIAEHLPLSPCLLKL